MININEVSTLIIYHLSKSNETKTAYCYRSTIRRFSFVKTSLIEAYAAVTGTDGNSFIASAFT